MRNIPLYNRFKANRGVLVILATLLLVLAAPALQAVGSVYYEVSGFNFPASGQLGQAITLNAQITNTGNSYGHQDVLVLVKNLQGNVLSSKPITVNLDPGQHENLSENITFSVAGQFVVEVRTEDDHAQQQVVISGEQQQNEELELLMASAYVDPFDLSGRISAITTDGTLMYLEFKGDISQIERRPTGSSHPMLGSSSLTGSQTQYLLDLAEDLGIELDPRYEIYWGGTEQLTSGERQEVRDVIVGNGFPDMQSSYWKTTIPSDRGHLCVRAEKPAGGLKSVCELGFNSAPAAFAQTQKDGMDHFINAKFGQFNRPSKSVFGPSSAGPMPAFITDSLAHKHSATQTTEAEHGVFFAPELAAVDDPNHTSSFLIGSVGVSVILLESDGVVDASTENWTATRADQVAAEIQEALDFWTALDANANLSFTLKTTNGKPYRIIETGFEPINHGVEDEFLWIDDAMGTLGFNQGSFAGTRQYAHDLRQELGTDWAFTMFVVDSENDEDGSFDPGTFARTFFAYAYNGGPFMVLTTDNGSWGINRLNQVAAHELGHVFWATDEYTIPQEVSGYFNAREVDDSGQLMDRNVLNLSDGTLQQIGWVDSDGDGLFDVIDTEPDTTVTSTDGGTIQGTARVTALPNRNSRELAEGTAPQDLTLNTIALVEFSVDGGAFQAATPDDGAFDGAEEAFTVEVNQAGDHTVVVRAVNSVGNTDPTPETITISGNGSSSSTPSPTPTPSPSGGSIEQALDANGNDVIDDGEIKAAITLWIGGQEVDGTGQTIDDAKIKELITLWIGGVPLAASALSATTPVRIEPAHPLTFHRTTMSVIGDHLVLDAMGQGIERVTLEVFDLSGRRLLDRAAQGTTLRAWLPEGRWANGVYLYVVTAEGAGQRIRSQVQKFVVVH